MYKRSGSHFFIFPEFKNHKRIKTSKPLITKIDILKANKFTPNVLKNKSKINENKLSQCSVCEALVSINAKVCPSCGEPLKKFSLSKSFYSLCFAICLTLLVFSIFKIYQSSELYIAEQKRIVKINSNIELSDESTKTYNSMDESPKKNTLLRLERQARENMREMIDNSRLTMISSQNNKEFYTTAAICSLIVMILLFIIRKKLA